ncbi:MAG TPA: DNA polymerase IV [Steroidobacteraceae bacterium]
MKACRAILHVDMDAFYASVEQRDRPELRGKPLIVGGMGGRGVVAAASYEVRKFGVRSAMPVGQALKLCPHALCVAPRMARYKEVSRQIFGIFHEFTPLVEGLSLDEAFLDVSASLSLKGEPAVIARLIKQRIVAQTGLTASVGVATNKLVAKIASDLKKPDGLVVVEAGRVHELLDPLSVRRLPGLGRKTGAKVEAAGLATLGKLRGAPDKLLWPLFGRYSQRIRDRAGGIDERPVVADWAEKSISAEDTFDVDIADPARLHAELARLADRVGARLRARNLLAANVSIKIRRRDFTTFTRQRTIAPPTHDTRTIAGVARALLALWLAGEPAAQLRLLGVGVSQLGPAEQLGLFEAVAAPHASALDGTLDAIRERFGMQSVIRASSIKGGR